MRLPVILLACSLAGVVGGAFLIGLWAVGCAVIFDSLILGAVGVLLWELPDRDRVVPGDAPTLAQVLERARAS